ncbi:DEAD/DEAH box helicase family protein [Streptomyces sp. NPDC013172]|uniref:DEAD/DEAH box helicase family protein n=1 Tax=Streptomyces sp. NPDC013172 TaxID=3155009 RepID=UPI0033ECE864
MAVTLHPHQVEAVDAVLRHLSEQPGQGIPPEGLRTQVTAATGSGKTLIGVTAADRLSARRVLDLVPTLDLLVQTAAAWRAGSRRGAMITGELSQARMEALAEIDPGWCPAWEISWQRTFRLVLAHVKACGTLPARPGELIVQGEDLGAWTAGQRAGWDKLMPAQQWLLETVGIEPAAEGGAPAAGAPRSQDARWAANLAAARQFHAREGHLAVPRKAVEIVDGAEHNSAHGSTTPGAGPPNSARNATLN